MARLTLVCSMLVCLVLVHAAHAAPDAALQKRLGKLKLDLSTPVTLPPDLVFNDSWVAKGIDTPAGAAYNPATVDWASVIQSFRAIFEHESRIANWCTRACFHDGGTNSLNPMAKANGVNKQVVQAGSGGFDASLVLTEEQLREENAYDSFSTFVAAVLRTLVGFYDISYADGLAVCGATAREHLSYGRSPVYTFMPAIDKTNKQQPSVPFLVGRLDSLSENGAGLLPGATDTVEQFAAWFNARFQRGVYDGVALLGSHSLLDNQHCVTHDTGAFAGKQRMFTWAASATYYNELSTPELAGPIPDLSESSYRRPDPTEKALSVSDQEQCKFTSQSFKDALRLSLEAAAKLPPVPDNEPTFDWLDPTTYGKTYTPQGRRLLGVVTGDAAAADAEAADAADADAADAAQEAPEDPDVPEVEAREPAKLTGPWLRRTCDKLGNCYDGWPYTQNDGFLGQAAQDSSTKASTAWKEVRAAVLAFRNNPAAFDAAYGNAFNRLVLNGAVFSPKTKKSQGLEINGWECNVNYVAGDGSNKDSNAACNSACKGKAGCPTQHMKTPLFCRCASSPWGDVAIQKLFPNSTQTAVGGVTATPSGLVMGRKLLAAGTDLPAGHPEVKKGARCPLAMLRGAGLLA